MAELWERQDSEGRNAFGAFTVYRDQPPLNRSLTKTAELLHVNRSLIGRWSARHRWVERAEAWDAEQDRQKLIAQSQEITEMAIRHARQSAAVQQVLTVPVTAFLKRLAAARSGGNEAEISEAELLNLSAVDLVQLVMRAVGPLAQMIDVERAARGEPTDILLLRQPAREEAASPDQTNQQALAVLQVLREVGVLPVSEEVLQQLASADPDTDQALEPDEHE